MQTALEVLLNDMAQSEGQEATRKALANALMGAFVWDSENAGHFSCAVSALRNGPSKALEEKSTTYRYTTLD